MTRRLDDPRAPLPPPVRHVTGWTGLAGSRGPSCVFELLADGSAPAATRDRMGRWLAAALWPVDELDDIVYAVSEAVSNASEHAYPAEASGPVTVTAQIEDGAGRGSGATRQVRVSVRDRGRWRTVPASDEGRRRGLSLMSALMAAVSVRRGTDPCVGTEVALTSTVVRAAGA